MYSGTRLETLPPSAIIAWSFKTGGLWRQFQLYCNKEPAYEYLVFQDRWSLWAVVSQDRFPCIGNYSQPQYYILYILWGQVAALVTTLTSNMFHSPKTIMCKSEGLYLKTLWLISFATKHSSLWDNSCSTRVTSYCSVVNDISHTVLSKTK